MTSVLERSTLLKSLSYVGGEWIGADSGATFPVYDPATGDVVADVARLGTAETRRAIEAANAALPGWRATPAKERAKIVRRWYDLIVAAYRRARAHHDARTGQAARRSAR